MFALRAPALPALGLLTAVSFALVAGPGVSAVSASSHHHHRAPVASCSHSRTHTHTRVHCATRHSTHISKPAVSYPPAPHVAAPASVGPCVGIDQVPTSTNSAQIDAATLCLVNTVRVHFGLVALTDNATLDAVALAHARDMVANDYFDHTSPSGVTGFDRITASGYLAGASSWEIGENLAFGTQQLTTPLATVIAWFWSPEHRANMLNPNFRESGIGAVPSAPASQTTDRPAATYTQDFGAVTRG
jgi:uncharacterized protein YkwD